MSTLGPWSTVSSELDASVNHILPIDGIAVNNKLAAFECRFVQRHEDYIVCYLSSHTGCNLSCRFCHLTATGQVTMRAANLMQYLEQADKVLGTYVGMLQKGHKPAKTIHFNFMARGEALANLFFTGRSNELFKLLAIKADVLGLHPRFLVSTIMPQFFDSDLKVIFADQRSVPYYSLYSINPDFRRRWLPKAMEPGKALRLLKEFQDDTDRPVVLHWAFIEGQNDDADDVDRLLDLVDEVGLKTRFNLVRYNPHDSRHGVETSEEKLLILFDKICRRLTIPGSKIIQRVGFDVAASCGMFLEDVPE